MITKISLFKTATSKTPAEQITIEEFLKRVKAGLWRKPVERYRETKTRAIKDGLPAVTISGEFSSRDKNLALSDKLIKHSGLICIDIDAKDNPKMSTTHVIDHECVAQFLSCSGEGLKIVYRCKPVETMEGHWRIYDAIEERLTKKRIHVKIDSIVKSIASLQYVTYDPNPYLNFSSKLVIKPLPPINKKVSKPKVNADQELELLSTYITELKGKDVTTEYEDWNNIAFGLSYSLGEAGRAPFHAISSSYKGYSKNECEEKFDAALQRFDIKHPITIATVYDILAQAIGTVKFKQLSKAKGKSVGVGHGEETSPDLVGMVRFKMFLFKKITDKKTHELIALIPHSLNLLEFGKWLQAKNIFRFDKSFVKITDNIVEKVDEASILWDLDKHIVAEGDYDFQYNGETFHFSWEDIHHLWKTVKIQTGIKTSISSEVPFWVANLLKDDYKNSYVPYQNGVLHLTKGKDKVLIPYGNLKQQIWKDRILARPYVNNSKRGMFEDFFVNVMGRGKTVKLKLQSENFRRAMWYYGYMLHSFKDPATARAWMLYDINVGNSGRSGKSIIGDAIGKIRSVAVIDGKQVDFRNRFWLQTVKPWTDVIFIDDPKIGTSIIPMFNMITGMVQPEGKGSAPLEIWAKFLFASNWIMESEGVSESARQFISQLEDFYVSYSKAHGDTATPIVHLHGKRFYTEWDDKDWAQFDTFSMACLQYHLDTDTPSNIVIGDSAVLQFKQSFGEELFSDLMATFIKNYDPATKTVSRQSMVEVVKEGNQNLNSKACGACVRRFLGAIGGGQIGVTTAKKNHIILNVYSLNLSPTL